MKKQPFRFTFFLLMCLALPLMATAQVVDIPDPNLRAAFEKALGKTSGATITAEEMAKVEISLANASGVLSLSSVITGYYGLSDNRYIISMRDGDLPPELTFLSSHDGEWYAAGDRLILRPSEDFRQPIVLTNIWGTDVDNSTTITIDGTHIYGQITIDP